MVLDINSDLDNNHESPAEAEETSYTDCITLSKYKKSDKDLYRDLERRDNIQKNKPPSKLLMLLVAGL